ncbi:hypothetical protein [Kordia sp.]|uniref:hypothetical protein n=1 Tax=Kordia sp. TaxID=1965332 RepID=UPI003B593F9F
MSENIQNTPHNQPEKSTEIDLGELFRMIGKVINRFFAFLRNTLLFILDLLIRALIIVRVHIVKFAIVGILSVAVGWFFDSRQPKVFGSNLVVETNYGSARQLYSNIKYYNALALEGDSTKLGKIFGITPNKARGLRGFYIEPDVTENEMLSAYDEFMRKSDTTIIRNEINYTKFKRNVDPFEFRIHKIGVLAYRKDLFLDLQNDILTHNIDNDYIKKQKEVYLQNLTKREELLLAKQVNIDTLRKVYNSSIIAEARKTTQAQTHIQMTTSSTVKTNELELFALDETISQELLEIKQQRELKKETINVLSDFIAGRQILNFFDSYRFRIPILTLSILLIFILLRELNSYLNTYSENKRLNG